MVKFWTAVPVALIFIPYVVENPPLKITVPVWPESTPLVIVIFVVPGGTVNVPVYVFEEPPPEIYKVSPAHIDPKFTSVKLCQAFVHDVPAFVPAAVLSTYQLAACVLEVEIKNKKKIKLATVNIFFKKIDIIKTYFNIHEYVIEDNISTI
jgi:hypothetical protein